MADVYTEYYRLSGDSLLEADAFHEERQAAVEAWMKFIEPLGGTSARPNRDGTLRSVMFPGKEPPDGWRKIGRHEGGIECVPHKGRKAGKEVAALMKDLPKVHEYNELLRRIAPDVAGSTQIKGGNRIMFATCQRLSLPDVTFLASVPRAIGDGLEVPNEWIELKEAEYTLAFHEHNAQAARNRAALEEEKT